MSHGRWVAGARVRTSILKVRGDETKRRIDARDHSIEPLRSLLYVKRANFEKRIPLGHRETLLSGRYS